MDITGELRGDNTIGTGATLERLQRAFTLGETAMPSRRITLRIEPPSPLGDFSLVPAGLSGRPEGDMARAMAAVFADDEAPSAADVFNRLRQSFPLAPLAARVGALGVIMERLRGRA